MEEVFFKMMPAATFPDESCLSSFSVSKVSHQVLDFRALNFQLFMFHTFCTQNRG